MGIRPVDAVISSHTHLGWNMYDIALRHSAKWSLIRDTKECNRMGNKLQHRNQIWFSDSATALRHSGNRIGITVCYAILSWRNE